MQQKLLMTFISGVEFMNNRFDPFDLKLDGWSESVHENIIDYKDIFAELHEKYKTKTKSPPEIRLILTLFGSAFMFHFSQSILNLGINKNGLSGLSNMVNPNKSQADNGIDIMNNIMGQNNNENNSMNGPSNINELLKNISQHN